MRAPLRWALAVPALAALGFVSWVAIQDGRADGIAQDAGREVGAWAAGGLEPAEQTWQSVWDELGRAAAIAPDNPAVMELQGVLLARRLDRPERVQQALERFHAAARARPTSPFPWANIAAALYRSGDTGPAFEEALRRAVYLGPSEPGVQAAVADYGLAVWDEVKPETRLAIDRMVGAGLRRDPPRMLGIAARRGRLSTACRHMPTVAGKPDPQWSQLCQGTEATS